MGEQMTSTTMPTRIWADRMPDQPSGIWSPAEAKPWHSSTAYVREDLYRAALARVEALEAGIGRQPQGEGG